MSAFPELPIVPCLIASNLLLFVYFFWLLGVYWNPNQYGPPAAVDQRELFSLSAWITTMLIDCVPMVAMSLFALGIQSAIAFDLQGSNQWLHHHPALQQCIDLVLILEIGLGIIPVVLMVVGIACVLTKVVGKMRRLEALQ